jgi:WD40 repeat protein
MRVRIVLLVLILLSACPSGLAQKGQTELVAKDRAEQTQKGDPKAPAEGRQGEDQKPPAPKINPRFPPSWSVQSAAFSPDGKTLLVGYFYGPPYGLKAKRLEYWEVATGKLLWSRSATENLAPLCILPGAREAIVAGQKSLQLWNLVQRRQIKVLCRAEKGTFFSTATPSGRVCMTYSQSGSDVEITTFDVPSGKMLGQVTLPAGLAGPVALSPDGNFALCALLPPADVPYTVQLWSLRDRRLLQAYTREQGYEPVALSPDGKLGLRGLVPLSAKPGASHMRLVIWETFTGKVKTQLNAEADLVSFLSDAKSLVIADKGKPSLTRIVWATGRVLWTTRLPKTPTVVAISPDGRWAFTATLGIEAWQINASLWDLATGKHLRRLKLPESVNP